MLYVSMFTVVLVLLDLDGVRLENLTDVDVDLPQVVQPEYHLTSLLEETVSNANVIDSGKDPLDIWEAPYSIRKNYVYYLAGYDEEGRPIWTMELGQWKLRQIVEAGGPTFEAFNMYIKQLAHRMVKSLEDKSTPEHNVTEALFLIDFDGLDLEQLGSLATISYLVDLAQEYRGLIAKHLGFTVIVNANFVAENVINLVRPVFGNLLERVEVYGTNKSKWLGHVLKKFPKNQLPTWYGGSKSFRPVKVYG